MLWVTNLTIFCVSMMAGVVVASTVEKPVQSKATSAGTFLRLDPTFSEIVPMDTVLEKVAEGFKFIEGPVWLGGPQGRLLFSDIPANTVYSWSDTEGVGVFLKPVTAANSDTGGTGGSNGLALDAQGRLILCEHGNRRVSRLETDGSRTTLADRFNDRRLNSPNDIIFHSSGTAFFTDPPYGLNGQDESPVKEQAHNGIYRLDVDGTVTLLSAAQTRPNGIGLSPDENTLYVANSDWPFSTKLMSYPILDDLTLGDATVFFDAKGLSDLAYSGTTDGLTLDQSGNIYASGPGGVIILNKKGQHLGTIKLNEVAANVGWGDGGKTLYITASTSLYRIKLTAEGLTYRSN